MSQGDLAGPVLPTGSVSPGLHPRGSRHLQELSQKAVWVRCDMQTLDWP